MDIMQKFNKKRSQKGGYFMNQGQQNIKKEGFTIIEVVLVLAIAGLIFLMVFIALPNLQRGQRDSQRRSDLARISTQLSNYQSSNRGNLPKDDPGSSYLFSNFKRDYIDNGEYKDPSTGDAYDLKYNLVTNPSKGQIDYSPGTICGADGQKTDRPFDGVTPSGRNYTLRVYQENQNTPYCLDNR